MAIECSSICCPGSKIHFRLTLVRARVLRFTIVFLMYGLVCLITSVRRGRCSFTFDIRWSFDKFLPSSGDGRYASVVAESINKG